MGKRYRKTEDKKPWTGFLRNQYFDGERRLKPIIKMSDLEDALNKLASAPKTYQCITDGGPGAEPPAAGGYGGLGAKPPTAEYFLYFLEKIAISMPLNYILHVFREI